MGQMDTTAATLSGGANNPVPTYHHNDWRRSRLGEIFGVTLDDSAAPNTFVSATAVYNSSFSTGFNQWPASGVGDTFGTWGDPGGIYRLDGTTGAVCNYARVPNVGSSAKGQTASLGNICFDKAHRVLFVTNLDDGGIYQIPWLATCPTTPLVATKIYDHGTQGRPTGGTSAAGKSSIADSGSNGLTAAGRRVWAVQVWAGRLYYSVWNAGATSQKNPNGYSEIWSVALDSAGGVVPATAKLEITIVPQSSTPIPVSDLAFTPSGVMMVAERGCVLATANANGGITPGMIDTTLPHNANIYQYRLTSSSTWTQGNKFSIGNYGAFANAAGGIDVDCDETVLATGNALALASPYNKGWYGLQIIPHAGNSAGNLTSNITASFLIDYDGVANTSAKNTIGDIALYRRDCPCIRVVRETVAAPQAVSAIELVQNGNFELGNTGFTSDYTYSAAPGNSGYYSVGAQAAVPASNGAWTCTDHTTGAATGKFLFADGGSGAVWRQTLASVQPSTKYEFKAWVNNLVTPSRDFGDPVLQLWLKAGANPATLIATAPALPENPDQWVLFSASWTSPAVLNTPYVLEIRSAYSDIGNDFAIDDISFKACGCANGQERWTLTFQNTSGFDISYIAIDNVTAGVTGPSALTPLVPALRPGETRSIGFDFTVPNPAPGEFCFDLIVHAADLSTCCSTSFCVKPEQCFCIGKESVTGSWWSGRGQYCVDFTNLSGVPVAWAEIRSLPPGSSCPTFASPNNVVHFSPPLQQGDCARLCVPFIASRNCSNLHFVVALHSAEDGGLCCSKERNLPWGLKLDVTTEKVGLDGMLRGLDLRDMLVENYAEIAKVAYLMDSQQIAEQVNPPWGSGNPPIKIPAGLHSLRAVITTVSGVEYSGPELLVNVSPAGDITPALLDAPLQMDTYISQPENALYMMWDDPAGVLQTATDLAGPWLNLDGVPSPYINTDYTETRRFFRVMKP